MVTWFSRKRTRVEAPKLRSRSEVLATTKVDLVEFTPELMEFLGRAAYVQLTLFENLGRALAMAPTTSAKAALSRAAELSMVKHRGLAGVIEKSGGSVADVMEPYATGIDGFQRVTLGSDWFETIVTCYLTAGFLDDFFVRLAAGLPPASATQVIGVLSQDSGEALLAEELRSAMEANPRLASRLAMWGRRLVGDTMLLARQSLTYSENHKSDEARIEPVFTELIAAHTRRMDSLGLTA